MWKTLLYIVAYSSSKYFASYGGTGLSTKLRKAKVAEGSNRIVHQNWWKLHLSKYSKPSINKVFFVINDPFSSLDKLKKYGSNWYSMHLGSHLLSYKTTKTNKKNY